MGYGVASRLSKALILGLVIGITGFVIGLGPFGIDLEEDVGLTVLFKLRGPRQPPSDVVVVGIDRASAGRLNLPENPEKWPRSLHVRLIETLLKAGAAVIVFDMTFDEPRPAQDERLFEEAISRAHNIVLCEYLKRDRFSVTGSGGSREGEVNVEKLVLPTLPLARSALALAPFPLPKVPVKVSQYWTFKTEAGNTPTLPIVAFQIFTLGAYGDFIRLLEKANPARTEKLPRDKDAIIAARDIERIVRVARDIFENEPLIAGRMLALLQDRRTIPSDDKKRRILRSLIRMYQSPDSQYLNFYGPIGTIKTISYGDALQSLGPTDSQQKPLDFRDKAVFVGLSERMHSEQKDSFYTVFSQPDGLDLSGVEIAATAFANLLEEMPVHPLTFRANLIAIFLWGLVIGIFCRLSPTAISVTGGIGLSVLYLIIVEYHFKKTAGWYPLAIPLLFQTPLAMFGAVLWTYIDSNRERQNIKKAFGYYLPNEVVDQLSKNIAHIETSDRIIHGICLYTDAEHYTSLSETMDPRELSGFMNRYYEAVFEPVRQRGGIISNVIGDSMLAIWVTAKQDPSLKDRTCLAALDIADAVHRFNQSSPSLRLPTRIGLHSGQIFLGNIGTMTHYEYRPVGDIVNTATRLEGLNKYLGTQIAISEEVLPQHDGFLTRELGKFLLLGKSKPLIAYELLCRMEESDENKRRLCDIFTEALHSFRRQSWEEAVERFSECITIVGEDGPSRFYVELCDRYKKNPPGESWDGVVRMVEK